ncbi:MAG: CarD family transcriptional regulator [Ruminococcaceae bacterium]|nr:CarD family transcriptional regulator [Oscillospiraceae bacterium]
MYQIGDRIVYPMHGAGVIESIEERKVLGEKKLYYIMRIPTGDMTAMIPTEGCEEIGVRTVISKEEAKRVLEAFRAHEVDEDNNWNKRHRENMLKIKSGDIYQVGNVVKDLMYRDKSKGLSTSERKMLNNAKQILVSELVLSAVAGKSDIEHIISDTVDELF